MDYVIWSHEHMAWWRPNSQGYTRNIRYAGQYSREAAVAIVAQASVAHDWTRGGPNELAVRVDDLPAQALVLLNLPQLREDNE